MEQNDSRLADLELHAAALADMLVEANQREIPLRKALYAAQARLAAYEKRDEAAKAAAAAAGMSAEIPVAEPIGDVTAANGVKSRRVGVAPVN